jgi:tricorn protease-like protein
VTPITLAVPGRGLDLELRVTTSASGSDLPIILFSPGHGPSLYLLDPSSEAVRPIKVSVPEDSRMAPHFVPAASSLRRDDIAGSPDYALGTDGRTACLVARGDLLAVSANGNSRNLTHTVSAMEDHQVMPVEGNHAVRILTRIRRGVCYGPRCSPDGSHMLVADDNKRLWLARVGDDHTEQIAADPFADIRDATFSNDGT